MHDKAVFAEVKTLRDRKNGPAVSPLAFEIHVRAVDHVAGSLYPAFVPDDALDAIASGHVTTMAALELSLAGLWHRAKGGYVVADFDLVEHMSGGPVRRHLRTAWLWWSRRTVTACRKSWEVLNRDNFVPL